MLEILMFFRKIIRFILKFLLIVSVGILLLSTDYETYAGAYAWGIVIAVLSALGLIYYDRLLLHLADKKGVGIILPK